MFRLTNKQLEAQEVLAGDATHILLMGGSRSGKSLLLMRSIIFRALKASKSRHIVLRFRFNAIKSSIIGDTLPKTMAIAFPGVNYKLNKTDFYVTFDNGSEIWFGGLDDAERCEKILGNEYVTIWFNELSQIPVQSVNTAITRLAQKVDQTISDLSTHQVISSPLIPRIYYDMNPPSKAHWTYKKFILKQDYETKKPLLDPDNYVSFKMNPADNVENLSAEYMNTLRALPAHLQQRFLNGDFADANPNALFNYETIEKWRHYKGVIPDFIRVVVGVDPSGAGETDNTDNDAIGIVVGALGTDGKAYLLEDCTVTAGPVTWGRIATTAYDRHQANVIVGEKNYGGAMVQHVIQTARPRTPYKDVTATRGKHVRAEPFSSLYDQGKIVHVGMFLELEDEMCAFTTSGYQGGDSPNRCDAWFWVLAELFPALVAPRDKIKKLPTIPQYRPSVPGMGY